MAKTKVNDMCHCGSNKKYKKCCLMADQNKKLEENSYEQSEDMSRSIEILEENFPNIEFKNVSDKLNRQTYQKLQINHIKDNICQLAERIKCNEGVFKDRDNSEEGDYNFLIMYRGAYRILYGGQNVAMYTMSLKSFFANPSSLNLEENK